LNKLPLIAQKKPGIFKMPGFYSIYSQRPLTESSFMLPAALRKNCSGNFHVTKSTATRAAEKIDMLSASVILNLFDCEKQKLCGRVQ